MQIGDPVVIHTIQPATLPVPQWQPEFEPVYTPEKITEPALEPQKVGE